MDNTTSDAAEKKSIPLAGLSSLASDTVNGSAIDESPLMTVQLNAHWIFRSISEALFTRQGSAPPVL